MQVIYDKTNWNKTIQSFRQWDAAHEWGYFQAFHQRDESFQPVLFTYESATGKVAYPFNKRKLIHINPQASEDHYYLSAVYGYTGALVECGEGETNEVWQEFVAAFQHYCDKNKIAHVEEKFHPLLMNDRLLFEKSERKKIRDVVIIKTDSEEKLAQSYCKKDKRRGVRTAEKKGVLVRREGKEHLDRFLEMYYQTMDHNKAAEIYYFQKEFFLTLSEEFEERFVLFNAYVEEKIIESILYLYTPLCAFSFLSARDIAYRQYHANNLISQKAYAYFHEIGVERVNEGGGRTAEPDDPLFRYKQGFTKKNAEVKEIFPYYHATTNLLK